MGIKKFYLETYGCQMNEYDSHLVESLLISAGFEKVADQDLADIVILNTCSVRKKAEERALGRIRSINSSGKNREIAVIGCMAQRMGEAILKENPRVRYVLGTEQFSQIARLLASASDKHIVDISCPTEPPELMLQPRDGAVSAHVAIMRGCNNYCSYCVVPYVRGPERCRPVEKILEELISLEEAGCREAWLLGQNVNSYRYEAMDFPELLELITSRVQMPRIRFLTSHPKDFSDQLIEVMAAHSAICKSLHLPLQSGSNSILARMNRGYTAAEYLNKIQRLREKIPKVVITTDIIVGFPGESEADYLRTRELVEQIGFNAAFMFRYSLREGTAAEHFGDDVPEKEKLARLDDLINLQKRISENKMAGFIGMTQEVLLEGLAPLDDADARGKNEGGLNVVVRNAAAQVGELVKVIVKSASYTTLVGEINAA